MRGNTYKRKASVLLENFLLRLRDEGFANAPGACELGVMANAIHFEGRAASLLLFSKIMDIAEVFAQCHRLPYFFFGEPALYTPSPECGPGVAMGLTLQLGRWNHCLSLAFDARLLLRQRFGNPLASVEDHLLIVDLLDRIAPWLEEVSVRDDTGYWHTRDRLGLEKQLCPRRLPRAEGMEKKRGFRP